MVSIVISQTERFFLKKKLGFTTCKAEQPLQSIELQEKKHKKDYTGHRKSV